MDNDKNKERVIDRLEKIRKKLDLTKKDFCTEIGISRAIYHRKIKPKKDEIPDDIDTINVKAIADFCKKYNVNLLFIFYGQGDMFQKKEEDFNIKDLNSKEIIEKICLLIKQGYYTPALLRNILNSLLEIKEISSL